MICSKCGCEHDRNARYCASCHAAYMRTWRKNHPQSEESRRRSNARAYAHVYRDRGKIVPLPCQKCSGPNAEMHHPDHELPHMVIWLCRPCHLEWHATARQTIKATFAGWLRKAKRGRRRKAA